MNPDVPTDDSASDATRSEPLFRPLRLGVQTIGFVGGAALIFWCAWIAFTRADWTVLESASPSMIAIVVVCSGISMLANGAIFWLAGRPLASMRCWEMQSVNACASVLNYAPIRLGAIARIAYARRTSRMTVGGMVAWFTFIGLGVVAVAMLGALCAWLLPGGIAATIAVWLALCLGAGLALRSAARRIDWRRVRSLRALLEDPGALWGAGVLRVVDQLAWTGRMAAAASLLGLAIDARTALLLATVAILVSLNPLGRFGYREVAVAWLASTVASGDLDPRGIEAVFFQLAIVESIGEAIVTIPAGGLGSIWCLKRLFGRSGGGAD